MPKTVQIRDIPDDVYHALTQRAAAERVTVPDLLRRLAEREVARPSLAEWVERTRRRGGPTRDSGAMPAVDELRGPWPPDDRR
ncbi:MAG: hypothetical protein KGP10_02105 [Actinomycetales bacterium]|nr:hypothetical protein [Actinomycetales bacterium]